MGNIRSILSWVSLFLCELKDSFYHLERYSPAVYDWIIP